MCSANLNGPFSYQEELVELVKNEHEKIDKKAAKESKRKERKEDNVLDVKDAVKMQGDRADSQGVDEKRSEQTEVSEKVNLEKKDVDDGSKSGPSTCL